MGQYYRAVAIDKEQYVSTGSGGKALGVGYNGVKLTEHSWLRNSVVGAVCRLLMEGNPWYMTRLVWCGDYADSRPELKVPEDDGSTLMTETNYWGYAAHAFEEYPFTPKDKLRGFKGFILNHDKQEYVELNKAPKGTAAWMDGEGWKMHALPLLTADGNGRGGGDYRGEDPDNLVGRWAYDRISFQRTKPEGFAELNFNLKE